jgi:hypothetical protein
VSTHAHHCEAGRKADFGGRWSEPCPRYGRNVLGFGDAGTPGVMTLRFCDDHLAVLVAAGLVDDVNIDPGLWARKMAGDT